MTLTPPVRWMQNHPPRHTRRGRQPALVRVADSAGQGSPARRSGGRSPGVPRDGRHGHGGIGNANARSRPSDIEVAAGGIARTVLYAVLYLTPTVLSTSSVAMHITVLRRRSPGGARRAAGGRGWGNRGRAVGVAARGRVVGAGLRPAWRGTCMGRNRDRGQLQGPPMWR